MSTREDIVQWYEQGKLYGATFMLVVVDNDGEGDDYPVYVFPDELVSEKVVSIRQDPTQNPLECYLIGTDDVQRQIDGWLRYGKRISPPADSLS